MNRILTHIPAWVKNKYLISFAVFCVIILFLDKNDLLTQLDRKKELQGLNHSKAYYTREINKLEKVYQDLISDPRAIEKFARENYFMKRENEDLFIISEKPDQAKN